MRNVRTPSRCGCSASSNGGSGTPGAAATTNEVLVVVDADDPAPGVDGDALPGGERPVGHERRAVAVGVRHEPRPGGGRCATR